MPPTFLLFQPHATHLSTLPTPCHPPFYSSNPMSPTFLLFQPHATHLSTLPTPCHPPFYSSNPMPPTFLLFQPHATHYPIPQSGKSAAVLVYNFSTFFIEIKEGHAIFFGEHKIHHTKYMEILNSREYLFGYCIRYLAVCLHYVKCNACSFN